MVRNRFARAFLGFGLLAATLAAPVRAQVTSTLKWWPGVTFKLGDGFVATGTAHITVKLQGNDANDVGQLSFLDPATGQEKALFKNNDAAGTTVDLGTFPKGAPIVFKYVNLTKSGAAEYTGANVAGTYDFDSDPQLKGLAANHQPMPVSVPTNKYGNHQWAVAARVNATDVAFGFEDLTGAGSDYDFNDIGFVVTGVLLGSEIQLGQPVAPRDTSFTDKFTVTLSPPQDSSFQGATIFYTTDGSAPTYDSTGAPTGTTKTYAGPFDITSTTTVHAVAWKPNAIDQATGAPIKYKPSGVLTVTYTKLGSLDMPTADPPGGTAFEDSLTVTLTQAQGADIFYVLCPDPKQCPDPTAASPRYTGPIRLTAGKDLKAVAIKPGYVNSPVLEARYPQAVKADVRVATGGYTVGNVVSDPRPVAIPVAVVAGPQDPAQPAPCLSCADWKSQDPGRPDLFPSAPEIKLAARRPFAFDLSFYSHLGQYVNRAEGQVSQAMLDAAPDSAGYKLVKLRWYPVDVKGQQVGTGVYIAKGTFTTLGKPDAPAGTSPDLSDYSGASHRILVRLGYVRGQ